MISASHNPHYDNGIKFFSAEGEKLDDATEAAIEAALDEPFHTVESERLGAPSARVTPSAAISNSARQAWRVVSPCTG